MPDKTYTQLLADIQGLAGVDAFTSEEQTKILGFVNTRLYQAYNASPTWPRYFVSAQARPSTNGVIATTYDEAAGVRTGSSATRSEAEVTVVCTAAVSFVAGMQVVVSGLSGAENPNGTVTVTAVSTTTITNDTFTYNLSSGTGSETYTGTATVSPVAVSEIDTFYRVFGNTPDAVNSVVEYEFFTESDGCHVIGGFTGLNGFYVQYRKAWPGPYTTSSTDIPREFYYFTVRAAYADFLRMDAQVDKAIAEEQLAEQFLAMEAQKADNAANTRRYTRVSTHLSRQNRL